MSTNVEYTQKKLHAFDKHILKWKLFSTVKKSGSYKGKRGWLQRFLWVQYEWSKDIMRQNNESPKTYGYKAYIIAFYSQQIITQHVSVWSSLRLGLHQSNEHWKLLKKSPKNWKGMEIKQECIKVWILCYVMLNGMEKEWK